MKSGASNADKNLIEKIIAKFIKQKTIVNKKACHGLDFNHRTSTAKN